MQSAAGDPHGDGGHQVTQQEIDAMLRKLDARLKENPDDLNGWITLARTNYALKRYPEAVAAFEKASAKAPQDADLLADYADALAMAQGRKLTGKPLELIQRALKIDPRQWKALAMAGTEAFDRRDYAAAVRYWPCFLENRIKQLLGAFQEMKESKRVILKKTRLVILLG